MLGANDIFIYSDLNGMKRLEFWVANLELPEDRDNVTDFFTLYIKIYGLCVSANIRDCYRCTDKVFCF